MLMIIRPGPEKDRSCSLSSRLVPHKLVILEMALTRRIGACRNYEGVSRQANIKKSASDG